MYAAAGRIDEGRLTNEAQAMYEGLSAARWMLSFWLDVGRDDPAARRAVHRTASPVS
jgi:hypothetical protein